jgi:vacuolar-type H+-ATPase subunit D/Vma8
MAKITEEELQTLQEQEKNKLAITQDLGLLELKKHELLHIFATIQSAQEEVKKTLEEKYGKINVDLKDGEYTEVVEEVQQEEE